MAYTLGELASLINADLHGDQEIEISNVATLDAAGSGDVSFLANRKYLKQLVATNASAVVINQNDLKSCPDGIACLLTEDPHLGFAKLVRIFYPDSPVEGGIHQSATVDPSAEVKSTAYIGANSVIGSNTVIGENVAIGAGCVVGNSVIIGPNSKLYPNVVICDSVQIGKHVIIHPGVVLGSDGFGLAKENNTWIKIPQIGCVLIGDYVEIGANTSIDKGALGDTVIEEGVKIDNQVQIGHNVYIGAHTAIAGCVGIAGSTKIGKRCMIGGAVGISGHITITDDVVITAMSGVANSIKEAGIYSSGIPAMDAGSWRRNVVSLKHLYKLNTKINKLGK